MDKIKGKIAAIITKDSVIINKGQADGVAEGMIFDVRLEIPEIIDPDDPSNQLKGLFYTKGKIEITQVYKKMSYGNFKQHFVFNPGSGGLSLSSTRVDENSILLKEDSWVIKNGDPVEQYTEQETKNNGG
ncbi:hypothetical protein EHO58_01545 [Leptospira selangorensis]|uniref:hypothetical protein n=1 Tax=Leptospira selangorensis TaxID=2484982 RepID=UPI001082F709|nr:hypothetical protein [Leptospira selangorensis]TGK10134.1 hypothetical protein EHO58_01545 [Leptospira selangorensis]